MIKMSETPDDLLYTEDDEWIEKKEDHIRYGITDFAQEELGEIVYIDLSPEGEKVEKGDILGTVDSVKATSELYSPVTGTVKAANMELETTPKLINDDPYGEGWIAEIDLDDDSELENLMSAEEYELHTE